MVLLDAETNLGGLVLPTFILWLLALSAIVTAAYTIYTKAIRPIAGAVRHVQGTYDKIIEYGPRLEAVEQNTLQLKNNGGSSLRDAVDRIEAGAARDRIAFQDHLTWANQELVEIYKQLASRDVIQSAEKTAEKIEEGVKKHNDIRD